MSEHKKIDKPMVGSIGIYRTANDNILAHATVVSQMEGDNVKFVNQKDGFRQTELNFEVENVRYTAPTHKAVEYWE